MSKMLIINDRDCLGVEFTVGEDVGISDVTKRLTALGFTRVDRIENHGEFSARGDILDIFQKNQTAIRLLFFGDEIESIKEINPNDFMAIKQIKSVQIAPISDKVFFTHFKKTINVHNAEIPVEIMIKLSPLGERPRNKVFIVKPTSHNLYLYRPYPNENLFTAFRGDTKIGNLVMHEKYGLGKYIGVKKMSVGNITNKYIVLQYHKRAVIYVPLSQVSVLHAYHGATRRLDKI